MRMEVSPDNGVTWQPEACNRDVVLLPLAARTTLQHTADQANVSGNGVIITLNVTQASGTGGLTIALEGKDALGNYYSVKSMTAVTQVGLSSFAFFPSLTTGYTNGNSTVLPPTWRVTVSVGDASSYTYSVCAGVVG